VPEDFDRLGRVSMSAEHLTPLLDEFDAAQCTAVARRLREADVWQVPNLVLWKAWASAGRVERQPSSSCVSDFRVTCEFESQGPATVRPPL
jgi:hypothetical protein